MMPDAAPSPAPLTTTAFLLTADWEDTAGGHLLRYFGRSPEHGVVEVVVDDVRPVFFVARAADLGDLGVPFDRRAVELRTFADDPVDALYFKRHADLKAAAERLRARGIEPCESDVRPEERYLMERFVHGQAEITGPARCDGRRTRFVNPRVRPAEVRPELVICSLDIETSVTSGALYAVGVHVTGPGGRDERRVFMLADRDGGDGAPVSRHAGEVALLRAFLAWFDAADPDLVIGWHVIGFDLDFLLRRGQALGVRVELGRGGGRATHVRRLQSGGWRAGIPGRVVLDGPPVLRAAFHDYDDWRLETVARAVLGRGKHVRPEQDRAAEVERMFREDPAALARYNLEDCVLVTDIFRATGIVELCVRRTALSGLLMERIGSSAGAFDTVMLPRLHRRGFVARDVADVAPSPPAAGGHVFDPLPGVYAHVVALDFKSLYPSVIRTFCIDPLSRRSAGVEPLTTPSGHHFSRREHVLPDFIAHLMAQRADAKRRGDPHLAQAIKILMNSFYGVMGSLGCRFYHPDLPAAITGTGQWLLKGTREWLEGQGYRVLYGDTDSVFVELKPADRADAPARARALATAVGEHWRRTLATQLGVTSHLEMEADKVYTRLLLPLLRGGVGGAKKRYAGLWWKDGREVLHFVGMEAVRSDWTRLARDFQTGLYERFLHDRPIDDFVRDVMRRLHAGELDDQLVYRKRLRRRAEDSARGAPPHVRAARLLARPGGEVRYVMTLRGPVPVELPHADVDHRHYVEHQLVPVAEAILALSGRSWRELTGGHQLSLL
jgi:DNA polymerase-2